MADGAAGRHGGYQRHQHDNGKHGDITGRPDCQAAEQSCRLFAAWGAVAPYGVSSLNNAGPHGLSEVLYAFSSAAGNNGSAFAGLGTNTVWWNSAMAVAMLAGRFLMIVPILAIGGSMVGKKVVPAGLGTFPTGTPLFAGLLVGVIVIVGALTFFPALCLGPIVESLIATTGKVYG